MKRILQAELKQIQLDMLLCIHEFCIKHSIEYSLTYGTLIGAIRHRGYIPWDDDIDIFMTRPNYNKFVTLFKHPYLKVIDAAIDDSYPFTFGKVLDTRTIMIEHNTLNYNSSVFIDLFQIDGMGNKYENAVSLYKKITYIRRLSVFKVVSLSNKRSFINNVLLVLGKLLLLPISYKYLRNKVIELKRSYNYEDSKFASDLSWGTYRRIMPKLIFEAYTTCEFEGYNFMVLKDYDKYLRNIFGDYLQLPPEDKRVSTHKFDAWWKE